MSIEYLKLYIIIHLSFEKKIIITTKIRSNFLPFRNNYFWDKLPNHVKSAVNVNQFKEFTLLFLKMKDMIFMNNINILYVINTAIT